MCDNPIEGGTTPSWGTVKRVREEIGILLYPIIRPRSGNYWYDDDEFEIMRRDVEICKALGCNGISVGISTVDALIDAERMKRVVEWAYPMGVTCNRVIDSSPDLFKSLEEIIACGCERVLTSGGKSAAPDAGDVLAKMVQQAAGRIIIMPGAGVKSSNVAQLRNECGAAEFHASARRVAPNPITYINEQVSDYGHVYIADEEEVKKLVTVLAN